MKKITIIVPFYNDSNNIKNLLDSIVQMKDIADVLIIDDHSDIDQIQKLKKISLNYDNVSVKTNNSPDKGAGVCRNLGIKETHTEWIMFADSDDHFLQDAYNILNSYLNSSYDMVFFEPVSTNERGEIGSRHQTYAEYHRVENKNYLRYKLPVVWSRLFKTNFIRDNNFWFDETIVSNDRIFALKTGIAADSIFIENRNIYSWDYNGQSLTTRMSKERFLVNLSVFIRSNKYLRSHLIKEDYIRYSESGIKMIIMAMLRYKYGFMFTGKVFAYLLNNHIKIVKLEDLKRANTFFKNNRYYKSND